MNQNNQQKPQIQKDQFKGQEYQERTAEPRSSKRNIRFTRTVYDQIRQFAKDNNWTFSRVVGEAVEWYMALQPLIYRAMEITEELAGKPLVLASLRNYLEEMIAQAEEAYDEIQEVIGAPKETKE